MKSFFIFLGLTFPYNSNVRGNAQWGNPLARRRRRSLTIWLLALVATSTGCKTLPVTVKATTTVYSVPVTIEVELMKYSQDHFEIGQMAVDALGELRQEPPTDKTAKQIAERLNLNLATVKERLAKVDYESTWLDQLKQ